MIKTPLSAVIGGAFWTPSATILGSTSKTFNQLIKSLFANGEQGFAYDPNDLSTMFQDAMGTVPVTTAGQTVGLVLDKSKGLVLGSELWSSQVPTIQNVSGTIGAYNSTTRTMTNTGADAAGYPRFIFNVGAVVGKRYLITGKLSGNVSKIHSFGRIRLSSSGNEASLFYNNQTGEFYGRVLAESSSLEFLTNLSVGESLTIDSISVKELVGNHTYQTQSSMRPLLVASPQRLDYDIADDKLITNLPAQLTGCTVVRAVPNVGTQILIGQTIPAIYEDNTDHCGLIVINRALTASETSQITKLFNKASGV